MLIGRPKWLTAYTNTVKNNLPCSRVYLKRVSFGDVLGSSL